MKGTLEDGEAFPESISTAVAHRFVNERAGNTVEAFVTSLGLVGNWNRLQPSKLEIQQILETMETAVTDMCRGGAFEDAESSR